MKQRSQFLLCHICAASSEGMEKESASDQNGKDKLEMSEKKDSYGRTSKGQRQQTPVPLSPSSKQSRAVWDVGLSE